MHIYDEDVHICSATKFSCCKKWTKKRKKEINHRHQWQNNQPHLHLLPQLCLQLQVVRSRKGKGIRLFTQFLSVFRQTIFFSDFENSHLYKKEINPQHQWHYILCHLQLLAQLHLQLQALRNKIPKWRWLLSHLRPTTQIIIINI